MTRFDGAKRIGRLLFLALAVVASLLTFPAGMVLMAACWCAAYTLAVVREKRAAWLLAAWAAIVLVKRVDWPAGLWCSMCLAGAIVATSMIGWTRNGRGRPCASS